MAIPGGTSGGGGGGESSSCIDDVPIKSTAVIAVDSGPPVPVVPGDGEDNRNALLYGIDDNPPWHLSFLLGFQVSLNKIVIFV